MSGDAPALVWYILLIVGLLVAAIVAGFVIEALT